MKRITKLFLLVYAFNVFSASDVPAEERNYPKLITVTGDAEVRVVPDEVLLTLGVETWNPDLTLAKKENDEKVKALFETVKKFGIEEKNIQTDQISIEPRYGDEWERRKFIGFFVRKSMAITLKDTSKFEDLLSASLTAGTNYVHGIDFRTTELRKYRDEARKLAIKAAKEKANDLAAELSQKVGRPHSIQEGHIGWWSGYNSGWGSRHGSYMSQNVIQNVAPASEGDQNTLALGMIKVNASVSVSFELDE